MGDGFDDGWHHVAKQRRLQRSELRIEQPGHNVFDQADGLDDGRFGHIEWIEGESEVGVRLNEQEAILDGCELF